MSLEDNNGTQYYALSCGVSSSVGLTATATNGSQYIGLSANDYILWGQPVHYTPITDNNGSQYYFLECNVASSSPLNLSANNSTAYYYSSAFNCVSFCDAVTYYSPSGSEWNGY